jgi:hypothetical protein
MIKKSIAKKLQKVYYSTTNEAGFGSIQKLYKHFKGQISYRTIKEWLSSQEVYTLHKAIRRKYRRRRIYTHHFNYLWEIDLAFMNSLAKHNDGINYLFFIIDTFTKYLWVCPLREKTPEAIIKAFSTIKQTPIFVRSDLGSEFSNNKFKSYLKSRNIQYYTTHSDLVHAAIVERSIRTIKEKIFKYLTHKNSNHYLTILPKIIKTYNNTKHRSIGYLTPIQAKLSSNRERVKKSLYPNETLQIKKPKFKINDIVRISKTRKVFFKGYLPSWTGELFKISGIRLTDNPITYTLVDLNGDDILGTFYEEELQLFTGDLKIMSFKIEKILKTKGKGQNKQFLVKWLNYPPSFNTWVLAKHISVSS